MLRTIWVAAIFAALASAQQRTLELGSIDFFGYAGIDLEDVAATLEEEGVAVFAKSFDELLGTLGAKAADLS